MKIIAAVDAKWAIGRNGDLLFRFPEDMKLFKKITTECGIVVMGRKTFESMNSKPLKDRENWIITQNPDLKNLESKFENIKVFNRIEDVLAAITDPRTGFNKVNKDNVCIIGGAQIYNEFLPLAEEAFITFINSSEKEADTFFPVNLDNDEKWKLVRSELGEECIKIGYEYRFNYYINLEKSKIPQIRI